MKKNLALFDFDGTITNKDTLFDFIRFAKGNFKFFIGLFLLSPILIGYLLKLIPNYKAKEYVLSYFFRGMSSNKFKKIAINYSLNQINNIVRPQALKKLEWHKKQGHQVVVVSASIECWIKPWCKENNLDVVSTILEIKENYITGKILFNNCYGQEKVNKLKMKYNLNEYDIIYAYGDSSGDKEMLSIATYKYFKPFRKDI